MIKIWDNTSPMEGKPIAKQPINAKIINAEMGIMERIFRFFFRTPVR